MVKIINNSISLEGLVAFKKFDALLSPSLGTRISNWFSSFSWFNSSQDALMSEKVVVISSFKGKIIGMEMGILANRAQLVQNVKDAASSVQQDELQIHHCFVRSESSKKYEVYISQSGSLGDKGCSFSRMESVSSVSKSLRNNLHLNRSQAKKVVNYFQSKAKVESKPVEPQESVSRVASLFESIKNLFVLKQDIIAVIEGSHSSRKLLLTKKFSINASDLNSNPGKCYGELIKTIRALPELKKDRKRLKITFYQGTERDGRLQDINRVVRVGARNKTQMTEFCMQTSGSAFHKLKLSTEDQEHLQRALAQ